MLKRMIKVLLPKSVLLLYHKTLAVLANVYYRFPSRKLIVIGVTGTKGKSSAVLMITRILEEAGYKVGSSNTIFFKTGEKEWSNDTKQGMPGRFKLQRLLSQMVGSGCTHAVIEVTSEGILQNRHWGIAFDAAVFTNLSPEHIESHGSFAAYREAKAVIFKNLAKSYQKNEYSIVSLRAPRGYSGQAPRSNPEINSGIAAQRVASLWLASVASTLPRNDNGRSTIKKVIVANRLDSEAPYFLKFPAQEKWGVWGNCGQAEEIAGEKKLCASDIREGAKGVSFTVEGRFIQMSLPGVFMAHNAMLAMAVALALGASLTSCKEALEKISFIPGRLQAIDAGQNFKVMVDYAHEPRSFESVLEVGRRQALGHKLIVVFGVTGGGRDKAKRPIMGELAAQGADYVILTTDDPYNDDPEKLINDIVPGINKTGKSEGENWWRVVDRRQAMQKAFQLASAGDVVLLLGKGSEQVMAVAGKLVPWNDEEVAREILRKIQETRNNNQTRYNIQ